MGALSLPSSGSVYLDTDAIIYSVEKIDPYRSLLEPLWRDAQRGVFVVVTSELALLPAVRLERPDLSSGVSPQRCFT